MTRATYLLVPFIIFGWASLVWMWWPRRQDMIWPTLMTFGIGLLFWPGIGWMARGRRGALIGLMAIAGLVGLLAPFIFGYTFIYGLRHRLPPDRAEASIQAQWRVRNGPMPHAEWIGQVLGLPVLSRSLR